MSFFINLTLETSSDTLFPEQGTEVEITARTQSTNQRNLQCSLLQQLPPPPQLYIHFPKFIFTESEAVQARLVCQNSDTPQWLLKLR